MRFLSEKEGYDELQVVCKRKKGIQRHRMREKHREREKEREREQNENICEMKKIRKCQTATLHFAPANQDAASFFVKVGVANIYAS